jgi:alkanesulfonate monooxygenase SsuD/methylene tetrahydromethanopterin reductase-like flavin-dependent oxidoreductase (luciferase family)
VIVLFTDATSGVTTYAANRVLELGTPGPDGQVVLDFNRATKPALRLHGPGDLPAAAAGEPAAGGDRGRGEDTNRAQLTRIVPLCLAKYPTMLVRQVADQLERLRDATEADELIITTITHDHADRVRSYQLLADEWARR